jgi:hypothetical protein
LRERRREVDGGPGGRLDEFDVFAMTSADELVAGQFKLGSIDNTAKLEKC